ncbi:WIF1-like protein [Mya arenaria]|uniref:WIF1-like protein n=1 Tax=Mya arenaria TaxID=6604 RepID=A0ABY7FBG3_MYAAR|nr:WIF1-like protein [Mya arenaria]
MAKDKRADYEYVRINFDGQWEITAMEFKRRGSGYYSHSSLRLTYSSDGYVWTVYNSQFSSRILGEDFKQEGSYSTKVLFYPTIQAQYIAFHPKDYAVLAVELYGCELRDSQSATSSPTHVDNLIDIDSTWTVSQSPFLINSPVTVKPGVTLDVQAGVDIVFTSINSSIEVLGTMATHGVPGLTVLLTSSNPVVWQPSQWKSVKQGTGGNLNIQHTVIRQGNYCVHGNGSRTLISSSDITFCDVGITLFGGNDNESAHESAVVYTNVIYSGSGLRIYRRYNNSYFSVRSSNFEHNNNDGIQILNFENDEQPDLGTDLRIVNCSISFNSRHGLYHDDKIPITLSVELSKVQNNKQRGVFFENNYRIKSNFKINIMSTIFETNREGGFKFYCFYCASFTFRAVNATFLSHDSQAVEIYNYFYPDTYRDEKQSLEIRNCKFTENKKDLELRLYPSGIVNVLNSRFTASSLSAVDIKMSSDAKIIGYVLISGNMFDGIFGESYSVKSTIKVDNALSKIVFNSFTNTSTPNILHIGSGFNHTISHNRFINSSKSTCFVTTGQLFHPTQAIYADYNYWGSRDENVIRQKKCDFFINSKLAVINVSFYFLAEQLTDEQSSENLELFKEANAVGGENVTVIGGVVKQNTSIVGFDGNIMLNRSIIVLEGARLALGNVSVLVASERGIVVYGRLEDEFEKANEHKFFSIDSSWNGFSLYNASLRISNVNINGTQTSFNLFGKCEVGLDRIKAEDSSQESFMYVHDVDNSSITIANTLVKVKKHMLHLREDSTTKAMSVDLQLLNSTFANADRYNTLLYIRCCSCHLRIIAVGCNFASMYEDTVYLHTLTLNMNANGNVFGRGKTNLDFQTCQHDNTSREVNITNNVFMSSSAGTNIFLHRQYGDSNRANHVFNIVGNKGTHSGLALRSFLKSDSYWYGHRHDLFLSSNTFEEFTKSVLEISSFFQNITIEKNIFVNNQRCLFYTGQHQDTFKSFEVKNNSFFNNSDNEGIVHISSNDFRIGEAKMQLNSFYNNTGVIIAMKPTDISLNFNVFENPMSIYNLKAIGMSEAVLNASYNFWDSLDKRLISNTIYDMSDDRELFSVTFEPYLASENVSDVYEDVQENNFVNENVIGGKVGGNVTLSLVDSPYILAFDVDVGINDTLTIDPGVKIGVKENRHINIFGTLTIRGTTDSPVVMVSEQNDVFWRVTSIEHLRMNATMTGFTVHEASVYLRNISSTYSQSAGISFIVSNELETDDFGDVSEVFVSNNKLGLKIQGTTTNSKSLAIRKCVVTDNNGTGIAVESDVSIIISNCFIAHNNEKGVYIKQDRGGHFLMNESTIFNHSRKAIEGYLHGDITLDNCIIKGHKCGYFDYRQRWISLPSVLLQEMYSTVSHTIRLLSTRFENNLDEGVLLDFQGSEVEVIVNNNTFVGGNRTLMFQGSRFWRSSYTMKFINNTIENNVLYSDISAFLTVDHTLLKEGFITENIFRNNKGPIGVKIKEDTEENCANIAINRNTFMDNTFASSHIHLLSTCNVSLNLNIFKEDENSCFLKVPEFAESKYVNATYNYWGTSNLSDAVERICGFDKDMRHLYVFYLPMFEDEGLQRLVLGENFSKDKLHSNGGYIEDDIEVSGVLSISRSIFVKTGSSFRIKPGSRLIFKENRGIYIKGSLQALSDNVSITFESEDTQRRWFGIYFNNSESGSIPSNIVNTHIMNTKFGLAIRSGVNVRRTLISNSSSDCLTILSSDGENVFDFENTTIEFCDNAGIAINSTLDGKGNTRIRNACIKNASIGLNTHTVYAVNMTLEQLDFRRCKKGLIINSYAENDNTTVRIVENNFTDIPSNVLLLNILPPKTVGNGVNKTFHISSNSFSNSCGINITTTAATIAAFANNLMRDSDCLSNNYCFFEVKSLNRTSFDMTANRFENINSSCIVKLGDGDHLRGKFIYNQLRNNFASTSTVVADTYDYDIFHNFFDNPSSVFEVLTTLQGSSYLNVTKNWWGRPDETYVYHRIHDKSGDSTLIRFNVTPVLTEREFDCHNVNNCSENGACAGPDYCSCISGWTGVSCSQHSCSELNNCYGNGVCVGPNDCSCAHGWTGKSCIEASCFNVGNCSDRGICIRPDVCQCAATFTGTDCTECKPFYWGSECRPCPNCHHGTCDMHSGLCNCEGDNWAGYLCDKCQETFYGVDCKPLMKVLQTLPSTGLDNGGYEVHIRGHNFPQSNDYFCKFGRTVSNGTWIGRTHVICAVPKHVEGRVYIEVSKDGQDYTDDKVSFNYYSTCPSTACGRELSPRHGQCLFGKCSCFLPWYGNNCTMKFLPPVILEPDQMQTSDESVFSYTKKMTIIQGDLPIRWLLLKGPESMDIEETSGLISWAPVVGRDTPYDIKIRAANNVGSDIADFSLMVSISYTAALQSIEPSGTFPSPRPVRIFGTVSPNAANRTLPVTLVVTGASTYRREVINVMTNLNDPGTFTCIYYPWADDVGSFTVTAHHPGRLDMSTGSISWSVLGMKCDPDTVRLTQEIENPEDTVLFQNVSFLTNSGDDPLYLITAEVIDFQDVFVHVNGTTNTSELVIEKLDPKEAIHFDVIFKNARPIRGSFLVVFSARDGTQTRLKVYITVSIQKPLLIFSPSSVEENVFRGTQKILDIIITNKGQIPADNISVSLPNDQRLSLVSITSINSSTGSSIGITVLTNEMAQMTLSFTTGPNENLGESFGTIALNTLRASFRLPYRFYISSNELFNVTVNIQDEYTYFADGSPLVSDAKVSLSNPRRGIYKVQVTSYETGFAIFRELYEDLYTLRVESDKHTTYNEIVLINEDTTVINVFLQRVAVKYTWTVEPTTFVDQYIVSLESTFETYVPMPVVTVEPAIIDTVPFEIGEKSVINFNVTNHGFIRADNVRFELPTNHPLLLFQSSLASIGDVDANTSVIVPVNITLRDRSKRSGGSVCGFVVLYDYVCGSTRTKGVQISLKNNYPGRPPTPCGNVWGFLIGVITYNPVTPLPCDCMKTLVKSCLLAFIPGVGCALSAEGYYNAVLSTLINIALVSKT